ncbi:Ig-like V-type domain-containing protein FAM187A [Neolamprologus brichardi]|uniref:Ig-like V-type domain-containing protein FAM187A n=1 Tax=Neolamprologus brichardi TaxID=32507 RepID=UPI001643E899|nr:Ig-like V-type domain-containing protein FAM187A [Neolamprologus brichardi]
MPFPSWSPLFLLFLTPKAWSYEAPEDKQDVFARTACPAFLTFTNAAYLSGVTVELPCLCKPEQVQSVVWFFRKHLERSADAKALTDHHGNHLLDPSQVPHSGDLRSRFSIRLFSLLIFRAGPDDAGIYICGSAHKDFFYGYDLDVQESLHSHLFPVGHAVLLYVSLPVMDKVLFVATLVRSRLSSPTRGHVVALLGTTDSASLPTGLPLYYLTHPDGQVLTLGCPGARPDMAVAWDRGNEPIYRSEHSSGAGADARLLIDTGHHLLFQPAQTQDSGVYYCWLHGRRAAEIHLLVHPHFGSQSLLSHPDFPAAVQTVLGSYAAMTTVFFLLMLGRAVLRHRRERGHVD